MTQTAINRQNYRDNVEQAPSRFSNNGADYKAWALKADNYYT